jgi:hypothetical protein
VGQRLGLLGPAQIGAPDGADHQRAAGEQRLGPAISVQDEGVVVRGVAERCDRLERQLPAEVITSRSLTGRCGVTSSDAAGATKVALARAASAKLPVT